MSASISSVFFPSIAKLTAIFAAVSDFPSLGFGLVTAKTRHPLLLLTPFAGIIVYILLYCLLQGQLRNPGDAAGTVFGLTLAAIPAMGIINLLLSFFTQRFVHLYYDAAALGALSLVNSSLNVITIMGSVAFPLLTAAAAMHWQRIRDLSLPR